MTGVENEPIAAAAGRPMTDAKVREALGGEDPGPEVLGEEPARSRFAFPLSVGEAIAEVTRRVGAISKDRRSTGPGENYNFRGIDDVLEALHPILGDVGLVVMPGVIVEREREQRATRAGGTLNVCHLRVRYTLIGPDGSDTTGEAWGEAGDSGDKATQKAMSQAYKSFALQTFSIPTSESSRDDPDATNEPSRPYSAEEQQRAGTALDAARKAGTVEELASIRHRAFPLLGVPLIGGGEGTIAPLAVWIDRARAALEGQPT